MLCPNCQQDTLLEGKEKLVCISCGYTRGLGEVVHGLQERKPKKGMIGRPQTIIKKVPEMANVEVETENKATTSGLKKKIEKVIGEARLEVANREIEENKAKAQDFASAYKAELTEILSGRNGRILKSAGIVFGVLLAGVLVGIVFL